MVVARALAGRPQGPPLLCRKPDDDARDPRAASAAKSAATLPAVAVLW